MLEANQTIAGFASGSAYTAAPGHYLPVWPASDDGRFRQLQTVDHGPSALVKAGNAQLCSAAPPTEADRAVDQPHDGFAALEVGRVSRQYFARDFQCGEQHGDGVAGVRDAAGIGFVLALGDGRVTGTDTARVLARAAIDMPGDERAAAQS